jgi:hypothetical protein
MMTGIVFSTFSRRAYTYKYGKNKCRKHQLKIRKFAIT